MVCWHDKKILGGIALVIIVIASLAPLYYFVAVNFSKQSFERLLLGQPEFVLTFAIVSVSMLVLIFAIPFIMAIFIFRDLALLVPLPFWPRGLLAPNLSPW